MLIGVHGPACSGKRVVIDYLISKGFQELHLMTPKEPLDSSLPLPCNIFTSSDAFLDFVTRNWRENFVILLSESSSWLLELSVRPFFLLLSVDAPIVTRWRRLRGKRPSSEADLESFVTKHDKLVMPRPTVSAGTPELLVVDDLSTKEELYEKLDKLNLLDAERLRPGWDTYFMTLANLASLRSNCMKRRVGAIIVRERRIIATGYNGTPRNLVNCNEGGCPRCNGGKNQTSGDECLCLHAEENALLEAGRERVGAAGVLYCNTCPCLKCAIKIVQSGVQEVVYSLAYRMDDATARVFRQAGVTLRQYSTPS